MVNVFAKKFADRLNDVVKDMIQDRGMIQDTDTRGVMFRVCWPTEAFDADWGERGRVNFHLLWQLAEWWKTHLSDLETARSEQDTEVDAEPSEFLIGRIRNFLGELRTEDAGNIYQWEEQFNQERYEIDGKEEMLDCVRNTTLDDFYDAPLSHQRTGHRAGTVRERLARAIKNIHRQAKQNVSCGGEVDYIVLAGSGSRLPLLKEVLIQEFERGKGVQIVQEPDVAKLPDMVTPGGFAKLRVAFGLAVYADLCHSARSLIRGFHKPNSIVKTSLGLRGTDGLNVIVPVGTHWENGDPHSSSNEFSFRLPSDRISEGSFQQDGSQQSSSAIIRLDAYTGDGVGVFNLCDPNVQPQLNLPNRLQDTAFDAFLRVLGRHRIQLCIKIGGQGYGPFEIYWQVNQNEL